jgi:hypothetical protein
MEKWKVPRGGGTHVLMDGGILVVPPGDTHEFFRTYVEIINFGTKLFVVEQKTDHFKFFVDLDYKAPEKLSDDDLLQFCSIIHESLGGDKVSECLIARARPRGIADSLIKSGVHIHWPRIVVTKTEAINLRSKLIMALGEGPWDAVIDASVYGGSGLRMLWSHKKPTGDPYIPWKQLGSSREFSKTPSVEILELFSIRIHQDFIEAPSRFIDISGIEEYVQKYIPGQETTRIKRVQRHEYNGWYCQTDSKYCENIRRNHKSNHVWFSVVSGRIVQRCFDEDCSEFHGRPYILPPTIVEQLNEVAVVGSPSPSFLVDFLTDGSKKQIQEIRDHGSSILGPGPGQLASFFEKSPPIRTIGFNAP